MDATSPLATYLSRISRTALSIASSITVSQVFKKGAFARFLKMGLAMAPDRLLIAAHPPKPSGAGREAAGEIRWPLLFMALRTNIYIDGFNLYYGCIKKTPHRWLDLGALCSKLLPKNTIHRIRYFTALLTPRPHGGRQ